MSIPLLTTSCASERVCNCASAARVDLRFTSTDGEHVLGIWNLFEEAEAPDVTGLNLNAGTSYELAVVFWREDESLNDEIAASGWQYQVLFAGSALGPLVEQDYLDFDINGLPVGLLNSVETVGSGDGEFTVALASFDGASKNPKPEGLEDLVELEGIDSLADALPFVADFHLTVRKTND